MHIEGALQIVGALSPVRSLQCHNYSLSVVCLLYLVAPQEILHACEDVLLTSPDAPGDSTMSLWLIQPCYLIPIIRSSEPPI